ncbi:MAG: cyclic pyranopterin monophosphate synthase MoaC [Planctomycetes bacterium]|nr:cyclic pyranopterin monophosphate synthase MoaC [Planctomycetota bacterium]
MEEGARRRRGLVDRGRRGASRLTHVAEDGTARMVDVAGKPPTERTAVAFARIGMSPATLRLLRAGRLTKGDVFSVARVAGIQAAKRTHELIPLCHPIALTQVTVECAARPPRRVEIRTTARATDRTGVEMEALTAAAVAALTVYDMCKAVDRGMTLGPIRLEEKRGGRSGTYRRRK